MAKAKAESKSENKSPERIIVSIQEERKIRKAEVIKQRNDRPLNMKKARKLIHDMCEDIRIGRTHPKYPLLVDRVSSYGQIKFPNYRKEWLQMWVSYLTNEIPRNKRIQPDKQQVFKNLLDDIKKLDK